MNKTQKECFKIIAFPKPVEEALGYQGTALKYNDSATVWSTTKGLKWIWFPRDVLFDFRQEFEARGGLLGQWGRKLETLSYTESLTKSNRKQNRRHICRISPQCNLSLSKTDFNSVNLKKYTPSYQWLVRLINWPSSQLTLVMKVLLWIKKFSYEVHFRNFTQGS